MKSREKKMDMTEYFTNEFSKEAATGNNININVKPSAEKKEKKESKPASQAQSSGPGTTSPGAEMQPTPAGGVGMGGPVTGAPGMPAGMPAAGGMPTGANGQPLTSQQIDPMTGLPLASGQPGMPPVDSNNMRQSGLPTTAIVCNSDCKFAQNEKGMCSLNKIDFNQVKIGVFECLNYEPTASEPQVGA